MSKTSARFLTFVSVVLFTLVMTACADNTHTSTDMGIPDLFMEFAVSPGNYYLNGNELGDSACIQIVNEHTMRFINFDIDDLANYLVIEGTEYRDKDAEDFMERHNLPGVFNEEIEYDYNEDDGYIYINALSNENEPDNGESYFTVNYRMEYVDRNTIIFRENVYICPDGQAKYMLVHSSPR